MAEVGKAREDETRVNEIEKSWYECSFNYWDIAKIVCGDRRESKTMLALRTAC